MGPNKTRRAKARPPRLPPCRAARETRSATSTVWRLRLGRPGWVSSAAPVVFSFERVWRSSSTLVRGSLQYGGADGKQGACGGGAAVLEG
jgi:hypothetical protein